MVIWSSIVKFYEYLVVNKVARSLFLFLLPCVILGGFVYGKYIKKNDVVIQSGECDFLKTQNKELVEAIINWQKQLKPLVPNSTTFVTHEIGFSFASYIDTTIPVRTQRQQQQRQQVLDRVWFQMDSVLIKLRMDSLTRADSLIKLKKSKQ